MSTQRNEDEAEIRALLETYERALNQSDPVLAAACYASDGIFMPTTLPTVQGAALEDGYSALFGEIRLLVTFTIDELVVASELTAYAMTRSSGTQVVTATGEQTAESNRELFIFSKLDGSWKISRYLFNKPA